MIKWLAFLLTIQMLAGIAFAFRPLSFNIWEPNEGIHDAGDWLSLAVGILFLSSAGLSWYGLAHHRLWCWAFTGIPLLKLILDVTGLVLLYFSLFQAKPLPPEDSTEE